MPDHPQEPKSTDLQSRTAPPAPSGREAVRAPGLRLRQQLERVEQRHRLTRR